MVRLLRAIGVFILSLPIWVYRIFISPLKGPSCRHTPSCSAFFIDALKQHGPIHGFGMGANRVLRCRPGGTHGYDPVPEFRFKRYKLWDSWLGRWPKSNRLKPR